MNRRNDGRARRGWLLAVVVIAVAALAGVGLLRPDGDRGTPQSRPAAGASTATPGQSATPSPTASRTLAVPPPAAPPAIVRPKCLGPDDPPNPQSLDLETLAADCGTEPVAPDSPEPLGLACGGKYPSIMYKTTTTNHKTSICGHDSSGEFNYLVTQLKGGATIDMVAEYAPGLDAFVGTKDGVTYTVEAYNGSLTIERAGKRVREPSTEWISLDNEQDTD